MNRNVVKHQATGHLYEVEYVVHPATTAPEDTPDVFACHLLSAYDGMPIGGKVWIASSEFTEEDQARFK